MINLIWTKAMQGSAQARILAVAIPQALCLLLSVGVLTTSASAAPLHTETAFSPIDGSGIGANVKGVTALAADEATGNVLLADIVNGVVYIMGSEGGVPTGVAPPYEITVGDFEAFSGQRNLVAVDNSDTSPNHGAVYLLVKGKVKKYVRNPGTEQYEVAGELAAVPPVAPEGAPATGVAVDEEGNVYVAYPFAGNGSRGVIVKFDPSGTTLAQLEMTAATERPVYLALDSAGDLFVATDTAKAFKFPVNGFGDLEVANFVSVPSFFRQATSLPVDKAHNTLLLSSRGDITEFDATTLAEKGDFTSSTGESDSTIAVNSAAGFIYMLHGGDFQHDILAFNLDGPTLPDVGTTAPSEVTATKARLNGVVNPEGVAVGECKFVLDEFTPGGPTTLPCEGALPSDSADHAVSAEVSGLAPNSGHGYRLVVSNANGSNRSQLNFLTTEPIAETTAATAITPDGASLNGIVRPEGSAIGECKFEFGPTTDYGTTLPCEPEAGAIPADTDPHQVGAELSGLLVGVTYHYRLVAAGGLGSEVGKDFSFRTLGASVVEQFFSGLTENSVKLEALINPRGKATSYRFEYGPGPCDANPCTSVPVPDEAIGAGETDVGVAQLVEGLSPASTYHYRVVVTNSDGVGHSADGTFTTFNVSPGFDACANDGFRLGHPSARLPDCRAYEQATPIDKNGADVTGSQFVVQASLAGDGITSETKGNLPGAEGAQQYPIHLSQRGADGWSTQGLLPPPSLGERAQVLAWTPDLRFSLSLASFAGSDEAGYPESGLFLRDSATHAIQQIAPYSKGDGIFPYALAGASADDSKIFFEARGQGVNLTGNAATSKDNLYLWDRETEELSLVGILPGGTAPPGGSFAGPFNWWPHVLAHEFNNGGALGEEAGASDSYLTQDLHAIAADGSRAFFTAGLTGQIYLREGIGGEEPETKHVSASQRAVADPGGAKPAIFMGAAADGSKAFFASCEKLTDDSTAHSTAANDCQMPEQGQDLYAYDAASGELSDLTVDAGDPQGAEVKGVVGTSEDGSYIYFVANGDLDGAGEAEAGDCQNPPNKFGEFRGFHGLCSLYLWHAGTISFVARLDGSDSRDWLPGGRVEETVGRVSADGRTVVFQSKRQLTGYETTPRGGCAGVANLPCAQFYRFQVGDPELRCLTCNPTGAPPSGIEEPGLASIEVGVTYYTHPLLTRNLAASGNRFFFETPEKLVSADVNGDNGCPKRARPYVLIPTCQDVYEWEAPGTGSCTEASSAFSDQDGGCLYLLSGGTGSDPSFFADASASGDDVFIFTSGRLVPGDEDELFDIYDVSVGGGLASQNQPPPPPPCEGQGCLEGATSPPSGPSAGSAGFSGPGDPPVKRVPKKHKKHHKPKHHKKHHKGGAKKRAGAEQGGQK
jgi:hypothetical protein